MCRLMVVHFCIATIFTATKKAYVVRRFGCNWSTVDKQRVEVSMLILNRDGRRQADSSLASCAC